MEISEEDQKEARRQGYKNFICTCCITQDKNKECPDCTLENNYKNFKQSGRYE